LGERVLEAVGVGPVLVGVGVRVRLGVRDGPGSVSLGIGLGVLVGGIAEGRGVAVGVHVAGKVGTTGPSEVLVTGMIGDSATTIMNGSVGG
jgi:hypothetical protein